MSLGYLKFCGDALRDSGITVDLKRGSGPYPDKGASVENLLPEVGLFSSRPLVWPFKLLAPLFKAFLEKRNVYSLTL